MPSGPTHRRITQGLMVATTPLIVINPLVTVGIEAGIAITLYVNPDLDLYSGRVPKLLRPFGFDTYQREVPHRFGLNPKHWHKLTIWRLMAFSHLPIFGTGLRFIMVISIPLMLLFMTSLINETTLRLLLSIYIGMAISDAGHILVDVIYSAYKRRSKNQARNGENTRYQSNNGTSHKRKDGKRRTYQMARTKSAYYSERK